MTFEEGQKRPIRVQYFQGPRFKIAMQLFYRRVQSGSDMSRPCNNGSGGLQIVGPEAYSHPVQVQISDL